MIVKAEQPDNARIYPTVREFATNGKLSSGARSILDETGVEGLRAFYGHITETFINKLEWPAAYDIYNEMRRRDPTLRSMLNVIKMLARQATWKGESFTDKPPDREAGDHLQSCLEDTSHTIEDFIDDVFSFLPFGWSSFEICYKRRQGEGVEVPSMFDDNKIGWRKFAFRRQSSFDRWEFDKNGGFNGWWQMAAPKYEDVWLPPEYLLHFVGERDGNNPEGIAIFESAYEPWHFVKNLQIISGIGWQRAFVGLPVFEFQETPQAGDKALVETTGKGLTADEKQFISVPPGIKFRLESTQNTSADALLSTIKMYRALMLQITLSEFIMMAMLGTGSFSQHKDKTDLFMMAVNGYLDKIAAVWNKFGVKRLFDFEVNRVPGMTGLPRITHSEVRKPDLEILGKFIQEIAPYIKLDRDDEIWIRDQASMPQVSEDDQTDNPPEIDKPDDDVDDNPPAEDEPDTMTAGDYSEIISQVLADLKEKDSDPPA